MLWQKNPDRSSAYLMQEDAKGKSNFPANCFASSKSKCSKCAEQSEIELSHPVCMCVNVFQYIVVMVPGTKTVPKSWRC